MKLHYHIDLVVEKEHADIMRARFRNFLVEAKDIFFTLQTKTGIEPDPELAEAIKHSIISALAAITKPEKQPH